MYYLTQLLKKILSILENNKTNKARKAEIHELKSVQHNETVVIGFVQCRNCKCTWEAMAHSNTTHKLECPKCSTQNSKVIGPSLKHKENK